MKPIKTLGLVVAGSIALLVAFSGKDVSALETLVTVKEVPLTIIVVAASPSAYAPNPQGARLQVASISSYDVPMGILPPVVIGQSAQTQGSVPVKFQTVPDPTATYLHEIPINTTLTAPVGGTTNFTCPFEMYAYYTKAYEVTDWGYGTGSGDGAGTFPINNYSNNSATNSDLSFNVTAVGVPPAANAAYTIYSNDGAPGQTSFTGTAGETQTQCINLSLKVPVSIAPGTYSAVIQYNLYHS